jgi:Fe-S oxidoreductase
MIDFPRLMSRAKIVQAREEGLSLPERIGQRQDLLGKASCLTSTLTNAAFRNRAARILMEKLSGLDRRWRMPTYEGRPVSRQLPERRSGEPGRNGRALLFGTCFVEYSEARTAHAAVQVLEHNGVSVEYGYEACCGAPFLHGGDLESARRNAERLVTALHPSVKQGVPVLVPGPTCSYQLKHEIAELCPTEAAREVSERTYDLGEYLFELAREQKLNREFPRRLTKVTYHLPCHLKSQNLGFRSARLLGLIADEVVTLDHCSGVDGTWGMQARWFDLSQRIADKLIQGIDASEPERIATDCPLAALRIEERTGHRADHPVVLLRDAYGLRAHG